MSNQDRFVRRAVHKIVEQAQRRQAGKSKPFLIAIDGGSGSGKSIVASAVAEKLGAALVPGDDFFAANITDEAWAQRGVKARAADCIDWQRLRREALEPLLAGKRARWQAFDFESGARADGAYGMLAEFVECGPANVIVLDGAYSARPELSDLIDLAVLVDVPIALRHERLSAREERAWLNAWHARWDGAEEYYFTQVRPVSSFDLVITSAPSRK
jgi:para-aminobenzoate synthetase